MALPATQIEAATTNYFDKKLTSQIAFSDPLWFKLFEKARSGGNGRNYVWKPKYARRPTQWLGRYGIKNRTPLDYFTDASLPWVLNNTPAVLDGSDIALNKGEAQLIELLAEELKSLRDDTIYNTAQKLYSGTGGLEPYGLTVAVPTTVTSGTYAGIDRSSYSWWRPNAVDASGADVSLNLLEELKLECTHGTDKPDLILTGKEGYRRLYNKATALQRLPVTGEAKRLAALGFEVLEVDGIPRDWVLCRPPWSSYSGKMREKSWPASATWDARRFLTNPPACRPALFFSCSKSLQTKKPGPTGSCI